MDSHIYNEHGSAGGQPTPSFIPPPLNSYNRLLADVLLKQNVKMEEAEMEDKETEDRGVDSHIYDEQGSAGGAGGIS